MNDRAVVDDLVIFQWSINLACEVAWSSHSPDLKLACQSCPYVIHGRVVGASKQLEIPQCLIVKYDRRDGTENIEGIVSEELS